MKAKSYLSNIFSESRLNHVRFIAGGGGQLDLLFFS